VQDEILTDLAKIADLKVISHASVMQYKTGVARNLRQIAHELGVANILEGSVQRAGNRVRVSAQLLDARNDVHLWAEHYDRPLDDVFAIQTEIAKAIADQLRAKLSPGEKAAIERPPTADLAAFIDRRQGHWEDSPRNFERALQIDPRNLSLFHHMSISYQCLRRYEQMAAVLDRALELFPRDVATRQARARVDIEWHVDTKP